jgi:hypothetical protein
MADGGTWRVVARWMGGEVVMPRADGKERDVGKAIAALLTAVTVQEVFDKLVWLRLL